MEDTISIPLARVKKIMLEEQLNKKCRIQGDAQVAVAAATEVWLEYFIAHCYQYTKRDGRKIISYKDVALAVREVDQLEFLDDVVPMTLPVKDAVAKLEDTEETNEGARPTQSSTETAPDQEDDIDQE